MKRALLTAAALLALAAPAPAAFAHSKEAGSTQGEASRAPAPQNETSEEQTSDEVVIGYAADDARMNRAMADARRTLPMFWAKFEQREGFSFSIKVGFKQNGQVEHMWVKDLERSGGKVTGILDNQPDVVTNVHKGDRVTIDEADISDWTYEAGGHLWGGYTLRVMVDQMDPADAAQWREYLSGTPTQEQPN